MTRADLIVVVAGSGAGDVGPVGGEGGSAGGQDNDATDAEAQGAGRARRPAASPTLIAKNSTLPSHASDPDLLGSDSFASMRIRIQAFALTRKVEFSRFFFFSFEMSILKREVIFSQYVDL